MGILLPENSISIIQGTTKTLSLTVKDGDGNVVDLTNATVYFTVKKRECDTTPLLFKSSDSITQIEIPLATDGVAKIYIAPTDTSTMAAGQYKFDIVVELASGDRHVVVPPSIFEVKLGITRLT